MKVELALARGKQAHDKRQDIAKRTARREVERELGRRVRACSSMPQDGPIVLRATGWCSSSWPLSERVLGQLLDLT